MANAGQGESADRQRRQPPGSAGTVVRGTLQVALAMLAAASVFGWLGVAFMAGSEATQWTPLAALGLLAGLYGLLAFAAGNVMGRSRGRAGLAAAVLGTMLAWGVLEFLLGLPRLNSPELRAPLIVAVPLAAIGGIVGMSRAQDREVGVQELQEDMAAMSADEGEPQ